MAANPPFCKTPFYWVRKVAERKFPEFFEFLSRMLPRVLLRIHPKFSRIFRASFCGKRRREKNSPKIPAIFQCKIPRQILKKYVHKHFLESRQSNPLLGDAEYNKIATNGTHPKRRLPGTQIRSNSNSKKIFVKHLV